MRFVYYLEIVNNDMFVFMETSLKGSKSKVNVKLMTYKIDLNHLLFMHINI